MEQLNFFEKLEETNPICPVCGNSFEKTRSNHVCCSQKCNNKNWNDLNKEKRKKQKKELYDKNRKKERLVRSDGERKQYHKEYSKKWYLENKQKVNERNKLNKELNKESYSKTANIRYINRYNTDQNFKLGKTIRQRIREVIKNSNGSKAYKTMDLLDCTIQEVREHLEKQFKEGMTWENHGNDGWHIDHIIPCASFDLTDPEQQKKCFHYTNLQPLWAKENMSKGAKIL
jgi:hypothetical protein